VTNTSDHVWKRTGSGQQCILLVVAYVPGDI
jgi:hypothetical protein